jgi:hypothetical protein
MAPRRLRRTARTLAVGVTAGVVVPGAGPAGWIVRAHEKLDHVLVPVSIA